MGRFAYLLLGIFLFASCQKELIRLTSMEEQIGEIVKPSLFFGTHTGLAIGVYDQGEIHSFCYGYANLDREQKVDVNTLFEIGSITKTFTAPLVKQLEIEGLLSIDDPIEKYLPADVAVPEYQDQKITIKHLLTHTAALPREARNENTSDKPGDYYNFTNEEFDRILNYYHSLAYPPGQNYSYSNAGFGLLGYILERITGKSYYELLRERIAIPLHMEDLYTTVSAVPQEKRVRLAQGYDTNQKMLPYSYFGQHQASGSIIISLNDMLKYLESNLNPQIFLYPALQACHTLLFQNPSYNYEKEVPHLAYGFHIYLQGEERMIGHTGLTNQTAYLFFVPAKNLGVIVLSNTKNPQRTREIGNEILSLLLTGENL